MMEKVRRRKEKIEEEEEKVGGEVTRRLIETERRISDEQRKAPLGSTGLFPLVPGSEPHFRRH
jgi:hypothetical protein